MLLFFLLAAVFIEKALAEVGGPVDERDSEISESVGVRGVTVFERRNPSLYVREYVFQGKVFAVCWHGQRFPNLQGILGSEYEEYLKNHDTKVLRNERITTGKMEMATGGHMRDYSGSVFMRKIAPEGFDRSILACR